jgi:lipid-A-disaccharide synthase-like uncharacterized protein
MRRRWLLLLELLLVIALCYWAAISLVDRTPRPADSIDVKIQLRGARDRAYLFRDADGIHRYQVVGDDGRVSVLDATEFATRVYDDRQSRGWWQSMLNVTSPLGVIWVGVGLLGQVLFTGRMVVQWLASERKKESVVPPIFWWMSLIGASMLLAYFLWRRDPVGVLGQAFGWFIYVRNLWLIHRRQRAARATEEPAPQPELSVQKS